ncbi:RNA polymerase sigma factor [Sphingomonas abietis]|uniref:RNA polymerase sigma factor n=1 Tax=Sphingomonas abietis TaxID=3012344 RepID=A0ABY7NQN0_9SPHN|nr:RNA polymerase sigma factor [Sphingomonas abietis]WBO23847.1 RNA polymerase sigma factor [Sphingomonas abietis]
MYHECVGITAYADGAFAEALDRHARSLKCYARRLAGNAADAEDLVQETMLRCWSARHRFRPGSNFGAWSRVVMRNSFLSSRRRDRFHADLPEEAFDRMPGAEGGHHFALDLRDIDWALGRLSPDHRDAVMLAAKGVPIEDAAMELAIPEGTFKSRIARGRVHLRELVADPDAQPYRAPKAKLPPARKSRSWKGVLIG